MRGVLLKRGLHLVPLKAPWVKERLGLKDTDSLTEMKLWLAEGGVFGGADAVIEIARRVWWAWPMWLVAQLPGAMWIMRWLYRIVARNRHCLSRGCPANSGHGERVRHLTSSFYEMP